MGHSPEGSRAAVCVGGPRGWRNYGGKCFKMNEQITAPEEKN